MSQEKKDPKAEVPASEKVCFVIMPIGESGTPEFDRNRRVYEDLFKPACQQAGFEARRADDVVATNYIQHEILKDLLHCPMAICDLTGKNPNVLFELGFRQAFGKPVVLVQQKGSDRIFDIQGLRVTDYSPGFDYRLVPNDQKLIASALSATAEAGPNSINSLVKLLSLQPAHPVKDGAAADSSDMFRIVLSELSNLKENFERSQQRFPITGAHLPFSAGGEPVSGAFMALRALRDRTLRLLMACENPKQIDAVVEKWESNISELPKLTLPGDIRALRYAARDIEQEARESRARVTSPVS